MRQLQTDLPPWRSLLFVPVINAAFVATAHTRGADAVILDCEDSVPGAEKVRARETVATAAPAVGRGGADVLVRINRPWPHAFRDIEAALGPAIAALVCPKVESPGQLAVIGEMCDAVEAARGLPPGHTSLVALIETAAACLQLREIAKATPRLVALSLGPLDLALSVGMEPIADALQAPQQMLVFAARAAGLLPLGLIGSPADFRDLAALRASARRSRAFGLAGAMCIHPGQVAILNEEFGVGADELARARRIIAAYDEALAKGVGAISFEGRMIDVPVADRARAVVRRAERQQA